MAILKRKDRGANKQYNKEIIYFYVYILLNFYNKKLNYEIIILEIQKIEKAMHSKTAYLKNSV